MLGTVDHRYLHDLMQSLLAKDGEQLLKVIQQLADQAPDFSQVLDELLSLLHHLALAQTTAAAYTPEQLAHCSINIFC
jgi:DNA polymerase-3 subunit gamma/tau